MNLPDIKISLPAIFICWCLGAWAAGMGPLLVYPLMWVAVALLLYVLHMVTGGKQSPSSDA